MDRSDTRERILDAAVTVYGREGSRGFSMRTVAAEVGITATAIYRHYPDKAALSGALVEHARDLLAGCMRTGTRGADSLERLWACGDSYVSFVRDHPQLYRLLFLDPIDETLPDVNEIRGGREPEPFRLVVDAVREAMGDGFLADGDPGRTALSVWAHLHGICALALAGRVSDDQLPTLARVSILQLYNGLKPRSTDA